MAPTTKIKKLHLWQPITIEELKKLQKNLGYYFEGYLNYSQTEAELGKGKVFCSKCKKKVNFYTPTFEFYRKLVGDKKVHLFYHIRCSECGEALNLNRF